MYTRPKRRSRTIYISMYHKHLWYIYYDMLHPFLLVIISSTPSVHGQKSNPEWRIFSARDNLSTGIWATGVYWLKWPCSELHSCSEFSSVNLVFNCLSYTTSLPAMHLTVTQIRLILNTNDIHFYALYCVQNLHFQQSIINCLSEMPDISHQIGIPRVTLDVNAYLIIMHVIRSL